MKAKTLVCYKFHIEVFNLKHIITCKASAQVLRSSSPKFLFTILAAPFAKVFIWFCDGLTKGHNNNSWKIIKFTQKLNMILKSRHFFTPVGLASVYFVYLLVSYSHYAKYTLTEFWLNEIFIFYLNYDLLLSYQVTSLLHPTNVYLFLFFFIIHYIFLIAH